MTPLKNATWRKIEEGGIYVKKKLITLFEWQFWTNISFRYVRSRIIISIPMVLAKKQTNNQLTNHFRDSVFRVSFLIIVKGDQKRYIVF